MQLYKPADILRAEFLLEKYDENLIKKIVRFEGKVVNDKTKPDGTPRKLLDVSKLNSLGWKYKIPLEKGIRITYDWFLQNKKQKSVKKYCESAIFFYKLFQ